MTRFFVVGLFVIALAACATMRDDRLDQFEAALAAQNSATAALTHWCEKRALARPARITALPVVGERAGATPQIRRLLAVGPEEALGYRHVRLMCGTATLSDATNWFVPARLTPAMNHALANTDRPFGEIVAELEFRRERLAGQRGQAEFCPSGTILAHRARLVLPDGRPISLVSECYTPANLAN